MSEIVREQELLARRREIARDADALNNDIRANRDAGTIQGSWSDWYDGWSEWLENQTNLEAIAKDPTRWNPVLAALFADLKGRNDALEQDLNRFEPQLGEWYLRYRKLFPETGTSRKGPDAPPGFLDKLKSAWSDATGVPWWGLMIGALGFGYLGVRAFGAYESAHSRDRSRSRARSQHTASEWKNLSREEKAANLASLASPVWFAGRGAYKLARGKGREVVPTLPPTLEAYYSGVGEDLAGGLPHRAAGRGLRAVAGRRAEREYLERLAEARRRHLTAVGLGKKASSLLGPEVRAAAETGSRGFERAESYFDSPREKHRAKRLKSKRSRRDVDKCGCSGG